MKQLILKSILHIKFDGTICSQRKFQKRLMCTKLQKTQITLIEHHLDGQYNIKFSHQDSRQAFAYSLGAYRQTDSTYNKATGWTYASTRILIWGKRRPACHYHMFYAVLHNFISENNFVFRHQSCTKLLLCFCFSLLSLFSQARRHCNRPLSNESTM